MKTKHSQNCPAPICLHEDYKNIVWCAGEEVCQSRPQTELQKKQIRINREFGKGRFQESSWTGKELERSSL